MRLPLTLALCSLAPLSVFAAEGNLNKGSQSEQAQQKKARPTYSREARVKRSAVKEVKATPEKPEKKEEPKVVAQSEEVAQVEEKKPAVVHTNADETPVPDTGSLLTENLKAEKGVLLEVDYLLLTAREDGLEYATRGVLIDTSSTTPIARGSTSSLKPDWRSGFRLGVGYALPELEWEMDLKWTWYHNKSRSSVANNDYTNNSYLLTSLWDQPIAAFPASIADASARWKLRYNTLDYEMGRKYNVGDYFTLRPYFGLRGAWIQQKFDINYHDFSGSGLSVINRNNFNGVGFRAGLDGRFYFGTHWSILGKANAALVWGRFHVAQRQLSANTSFAQPFVNLVDNFHSIKLAMEMALGFSWERAFSNERYKIEANLLWEYFNWLNQNQMLRWTRYEVRSVHGDLSLQGLSVTLRFRF